MSLGQVSHKFNCLPVASSYALSKAIRNELFNEGQQEVAADNQTAKETKYSYQSVMLRLGDTRRMNKAEMKQ